MRIANAERTFNSLSRDHCSTTYRKRHLAFHNTFNSLSRDHESLRDRINTAEERFQLPLSGSLNYLTTKTIVYRLRGFQLPLSGSRA